MTEKDFALRRGPSTPGDSFAFQAFTRDDVFLGVTDDGGNAWARSDIQAWSGEWRVSWWATVGAASFSAVRVSAPGDIEIHGAVFRLETA